MAKRPDVPAHIALDLSQMDAMQAHRVCLRGQLDGQVVWWNYLLHRYESRRRSVPLRCLRLELALAHSADPVEFDGIEWE